MGSEMSTACDTTVIETCIRRGCDFGPITLTVKDSDDNAVDLTGWSVESQLRKSPSEALLADLDPSITNEEGGIVEFARLTAEQTLALPIGPAQFDVVLIDTEGYRFPPLARGLVRIITPITQE
jgi:hypothetical protein